MTVLWQMQGSPESLLVPSKFSYETNCSSKPPNCSPIPLYWDKKHCNLVVMSEGEISYLNTVAKLMQNWGYVYLVLLDFTDNSNLLQSADKISKFDLIRCELLLVIVPILVSLLHCLRLSRSNTTCEVSPKLVSVGGLISSNKTPCE
jgi:hypothetical protein